MKRIITWLFRRRERKSWLDAPEGREWFLNPICPDGVKRRIDLSQCRVGEIDLSKLQVRDGRITIHGEAE